MTTRIPMSLSIYKNICQAFAKDNGYDDYDQLGGWLRATGWSCHIRHATPDEPSETGLMLAFEHPEQTIAFILKWS